MSTYTLQASITVNLECAHRSWDGKMHGHSYVAEIWFPAGPDLAVAKSAADQVAQLVDHTQLEDSIGGSSMEALGIWLLDRMALIGTAGMSVNRVIVRRPTLGFSVEVARA